MLLSGSEVGKRSLSLFTIFSLKRVNVTSQLGLRSLYPTYAEIGGIHIVLSSGMQVSG